MKNSFAMLLLFTTLAAAAQTGNASTDPVTLRNEADSMSYFLGLLFGYDISDVPFKVDPDLIISGFRGAFDGTTAYDQATARTYFSELQQELKREEQQRTRQRSLENLEEGKLYMEEVATREGVIKTESGLCYEIIEKGSGPMPTDSSGVTVHYEGKLIDGTVFDSSYERNEPASFPLYRVIKGWTEGVQLMPVGSTYLFYIPPELGYGSLDSGPIPSNSVLIFKIELLEIDSME